MAVIDWQKLYDLLPFILYIFGSLFFLAGSVVTIIQKLGGGG